MSTSAIDVQLISQNLLGVKPVGKCKNFIIAGQSEFWKKMWFMRTDHGLKHIESDTLYRLIKIQSLAATNTGQFNKFLLAMCKQKDFKTSPSRECHTLFYYENATC